MGIQEERSALLQDIAVSEAKHASAVAQARQADARAEYSRDSGRFDLLPVDGQDMMVQLRRTREARDQAAGRSQICRRQEEELEVEIERVHRCWKEQEDRCLSVTNG